MPAYFSRYVMNRATPRGTVIQLTRQLSLIPGQPSYRSQVHIRAYSCTSISSKQPALPPKPVLPVTETYKSYLKGSGPGGQKINKTNSAVQLTHLPSGIVVKSQATRSRTQNESIARRILAEKVEEAEKGDGARHLIKRARESGRKRSAEKKRRRKYRALAEDKDGDKEDGEEEEEERRTDGRSAKGGDIQLPPDAIVGGYKSVSR